MLIFHLSKEEQETFEKLVKPLHDIPMFFDTMIQNKDQYYKGLSENIRQMLDELEVTKENDENSFQNILKQYQIYFSFDDKEKKQVFYAHQILNDDTNLREKVIKKHLQGKSNTIEKYVLENFFFTEVASQKEELEGEKKTIQYFMRDYSSDSGIANICLDIQLGKFIRNNLKIEDGIVKEDQKLDVAKLFADYMLTCFDKVSEEGLQIAAECHYHIMNGKIGEFEKKWVSPNLTNFPHQECIELLEGKTDDLGKNPYQKN